jgi:hypothetical protein
VFENVPQSFVGVVGRDSFKFLSAFKDDVVHALRTHLNVWAVAVLRATESWQFTMGRPDSARQESDALLKLGYVRKWHYYDLTSAQRTRFQLRRPSGGEGGVCCKPELGSAPLDARARSDSGRLASENSGGYLPTTSSSSFSGIST